MQDKKQAFPYGDIVKDVVFTLSAATITEIPLMVALIREFAAELSIHRLLQIDEARLERALFGTPKTAEVLLGYGHGQPVSYALFYSDYSSFTGETGLHLEDLYVRPHARGNGFGTAMMQTLARIAIDSGHRRMQWHVLRTNEAANRFYERLGAVALSELMLLRLSEEPLRRLASVKAECLASLPELQLSDRTS